MSREDGVNLWRIVEEHGVSLWKIEDEERRVYPGNQIHLLRHEEPNELVIDESDINPEAKNIKRYISFLEDSVFLPQRGKGNVTVLIATTGLKRTDSTAWSIFKGLNDAKENHPDKLNHVKILLPGYLNELHTAGDKVVFDDGHIWNEKVRPISTIIANGVPQDLALAVWSAREEDLRSIEALIDPSKLKMPLAEIRAIASPSVEYIGRQMTRLIDERSASMRLSLGYDNPGLPALFNLDDLYLEILVAHDINLVAYFAVVRPDDVRPRKIPYVLPFIIEIGRPDKILKVSFPDKDVDVADGLNLPLAN